MEERFLHSFTADEEKAPRKVMKIFDIFPDHVHSINHLTDETGLSLIHLIIRFV